MAKGRAERLCVMILSLQHNYIYIRTKKTGSTTIEEVLSKNLGRDDVVVGRQFRVLKPLLRPDVDIPERREGSLAPTHVAIDQIAPLLHRDFWDGAFKFTSERHPYEKAVSLAYMGWSKGGDRRQKRANGDFGKYLDVVVQKGKYAGFPLYSIGGQSVVDDFIRLETLPTDLQRIGKRLGIPIPVDLPRERSDSRADRRPAKEILSDQQKEMVWNHCRREFEMLSYEK